MAERTLPIAVVARETGISADLLRKWETRYGFPKPARSETGIRRYPLEQLEVLRRIRRLIAAGLRPGEAIRRCVHGGRPEGEMPPPAQAGRGGIQQACLDAVRCHDGQRLHALLERGLIALGMRGFISQIAAPLTVAVGEAWLAGELRVHEEHMFSATLGGLLAELHRRLHLPAGSPRVLMTTAPGELHTLGLDMARALLAEAGACCIPLGAQTPLGEIAAAAAAYGIDVVALSYSAAYPARALAAGLLELRALLPPGLPIWIGGAGTLAVANPPPGVRAFVDAADAVEALRRPAP